MQWEVQWEKVGWLNAGFSAVAKMLNGKKFPQNVRALRIIIGELLENIIQDSKVVMMNLCCT